MKKIIFVASTGRTATTHIAASLNRHKHIIACHEGYAGALKENEALMPLINLENRQAYYNSEVAKDIIKIKRQESFFIDIMAKHNANVFVDVAYYNSTIAAALLESMPNSRVVGVIRDCEEFVRSCTHLSGEDFLPVGWPDDAKPLSQREKFIAMGRIKPKKGSPESHDWAKWSAIQKNIWLWRETNQLLLDVKIKFPDRVTLLPFSLLKNDTESFVSAFSSILNVPKNELFNCFMAGSTSDQNMKPGGYQVPESSHWNNSEKTMLENFVLEIDKAVTYDFN
jgi:hypothetical protein